MRNSSIGLKQQEPDAAAGSKRRILLWAYSCRHPAVSSYSSPFEVSHEHALLPGKQSRHNEANPLPAPRRSVTEDVLGTGVAQIVNFTPFIAPGSDVDSIVIQKACSFDVGKARPAS